MKVQRTEQIVIKRNHPKFKIIDQQCFYSKNLYNEANYQIRQEFVNNGNYINYKDMNKEYKTHENYKKCMSQPANCVLRVLDKNWKSFFVAIKDWSNHKEKYSGMPKLPKYLPKNGRFLWMIPNNSCRYDYENGEIHFMVKLLSNYRWKSKCLGRLIQVRFVPRGTCYVMEIVYEIELPDIQVESSRIVSIDIGVDNLITMSNNIGKPPIIVNGKILKSINQLYNKKRAKLLSDLKRRNNLYWSKKLDNLTYKRFCRVKNYIHNTSAFVIKWCITNNIDTLVVGKNDKWKQKGSNMQNFTFIPYEMLLNHLRYKCENVGIKYIEVNESYTSGTSYFDGELPCKENYDKSRRIKRGLFQSYDKLINADVNGSLQIMRKVFPDSYTGYGIEVNLTPTIINVIKVA